MTQSLGSPGPLWAVTTIPLPGKRATPPLSRRTDRLGELACGEPWCITAPPRNDLLRTYPLRTARLSAWWY
jgi:hypothetical protein